MIQTILTIFLSIGLGVGSTLLVQTTILTQAPVVAVAACQDPETAAVERAIIEQALEPLPVEDYVPQGRPLRMPNIMGGK